MYIYISLQDMLFNAGKQVRTKCPKNVIFIHIYVMIAMSTAPANTVALCTALIYRPYILVAIHLEWIVWLTDRKHQFKLKRLQIVSNRIYTNEKYKFANSFIELHTYMPKSKQCQMYISYAYGDRFIYL